MINIIKGEDRVIFLRVVSKETNEPFALTGWTNICAKFAKADRSYLEKTSGLKPAKKAAYTYESVTYSAVTAGDVGNDITLVFNGSDSIGDVVSAWNTANPLNTVSHNASNVSTVPSAGTIQLFGGVEAYHDVEAVGDLQLGKLSVRLSETDTKSLKTGPNQSFQVTIDYGANTQGTRRIVIFDSALNIIDAI